MHSLFKPMLVCCWLLALPSAWAAPGAAAASSSCAVKNRSDAVVLMLCPAGQTDVTLRAAAAKACESKTRCNVWIWDDAALVPETAPATDAELPKDRTGKAVAVWANDSQSLVSLRKAK